MDMLEEIDDLELMTDDPSEELEGDGQLYEHFRMEVDKGQEPVRINTCLNTNRIPVVIVSRRLLMLVSFMSTTNLSRVIIRYAQEMSSH